MNRYYVGPKLTDACTWEVFDRQLHRGRIAIGEFDTRQEARVWTWERNYGPQTRTATR